MKNLSKKICILGIITAFLSVTFALLTPTSTSAEGFTGRLGEDCPSILGMTSWDCNVVIEDEDTLSTGIWTIVANIATDITVIAVYLLIGFVVYGGYRYIFSGGDPSKVATGKKTLAHAFIGLAIVLLANVILNTIRIALGGVSLAENCTVKDACVSNVDNMVIGTINWFIAVVGIVAVVFVVYGGILYMTSAGDPAKVKKAKDTILYSVIGLIIVALTWAISNFVYNTIQNSNESDTSFLNKTTISKGISNHEKIC